MKPHFTKSRKSAQKSSLNTKQHFANRRCVKLISENFLVNKMEPKPKNMVKDALHTRIAFPLLCVNKRSKPSSSIQAPRFFRSYRRSVDVILSNNTVSRLTGTKSKNKMPSAPSQVESKLPKQNNDNKYNYLHCKISSDKDIYRPKNQKMFHSLRQKYDKFSPQFHNARKNSSEAFCWSKTPASVNPFNKFRKQSARRVINKLRLKKNAKRKLKTIDENLLCQKMNDITFAQYLHLTSTFICNYRNRFKNFVVSTVRQCAQRIRGYACRLSSLVLRFFIKTHRIIVVTSAMIFFYHLVMNYILK